jgi:type III pantothenate kinase
VDIGNTRIKWAVVEHGELAQHGRAMHRGSSDHACEALGAAVSGAIERVVASNVADEVFAARLARLALERWQLEVEFVATAAQGYGVRCAYRNPARLGVDRWVALVATRARVQGSACVVDAGTTVTFDALDADGAHLGGLIMAGPRLVAAALNTGTRGIGQTEALDGRPPGLAQLGRNTDEAVSHGSMLSLAAAVDRAAALVTEAAAAPTTLLLTGGEGPRLQPWLETRAEYRPHLVLEGLAFMTSQT